MRLPGGGGRVDCASGPRNNQAVATRYSVSDGRLTLTLEAAGDGWYAVTMPSDPAVHTQARTLPEAFEMARDAMRELRAYRRERAASARRGRKDKA